MNDEQAPSLAPGLFRAMYSIPGTLTAMYVWLAPALELFATGNLLESAFWLLVLGPIAGSIAGALWPLYWWMG